MKGSGGPNQPNPGRFISWPKRNRIGYPNAANGLRV